MIHLVTGDLAMWNWESSNQLLFSSWLESTTNMTTLTENVFIGWTEPDTDTLNTYVVEGGSEVVEDKLKSMGWTADSPAAAISVFYGNQEVTNTQIFLCGFKDVGRISAATIWGDHMSKESYVKIDPVDLSLVTIMGRMVADWVLGDKLDWSLKLHNAESGKYQVINKLNEEKLKSVGASKVKFRLHLALDKGPRLTCLLGVAPVPEVINMVGQGSINFPLIKMGSSCSLLLLRELGMDSVSFLYSFPVEMETAHSRILARSGQPLRTISTTPAEPRTSWSSPHGRPPLSSVTGRCKTPPTCGLSLPTLPRKMRNRVSETYIHQSWDP